MEDEKKEAVQSEITLDQVQAFLESNEEAKSKIFGNLNEQLSSWVETDEGKKWFQSATDKRVSQAINTFKEGHFKDQVSLEVEKEIKSRYPEETEEQKRLRKIEKELEEQKRAKRHAELKSIAIQELNERKLNLVHGLSDLLVCETEEQTRDKIALLSEQKALWQQKATNKFMAQNSSDPSSSDENLMFNTMAEIKAYLAKHPGEYEKVKPHYLRLANKIGG